MRFKESEILELKKIYIWVKKSNYFRGISLILSKEPDTEFKEVGSHFIVVFKRKEIEKGVEKVHKTVEKTVEKILVLIKTDPRITQKELMNKTRLTRRGVEWNLKKLKDEGRIKRIGPDKGGHWEVVRWKCIEPSPKVDRNIKILHIKNKILESFQGV